MLASMAAAPVSPQTTASVRSVRRRQTVLEPIFSLQFFVGFHAFHNNPKLLFGSSVNCKNVVRPCPLAVAWSFERPSYLLWCCSADQPAPSCPGLIQARRTGRTVAGRPTLCQADSDGDCAVWVEALRESCAHLTRCRNRTFNQRF